MPSAKPDASRSGITTSQDGERHVPSSTRADGSIRKEIRVRAGYRPPEDVEVYKNRTADSWKSRGKGGVPGAEFVGSGDSAKPKAAAKKNCKPKEARTDNKDTTARVLENGDLKPSSDETAPEKEPIDPEAEAEKEAKKLSKKLRQARDLQQKKEKGDSLLPEQFEKVIRINELIRQLNRLGFDAEGQKKP